MKLVHMSDASNFRNRLRSMVSYLMRSVCLVACLYIIFQQFGKYYENSDASVMKVKKFGYGVDWKTFPAITLCFQSGEYPLLEGLYNKSSIKSQLGMSASRYRDILLGIIDDKDFQKVAQFDFELNTIYLRNYLKKFRIQDTNENKYVWKYDVNLDKPVFRHKVWQPVGWNKKQDPTKNENPLVVSYLDPKVKCFTHHPDLDPRVVIDSIDLYFSLPRLASIERGSIYIYVHQKEHFLRNLKYLYKIRSFEGIHRNNSNNQLIFDLTYVRIENSRKDAEVKCNDNLESDDQEWIKQVIGNVSCIPSFWKSLYRGNSKVSLCNSRKPLEMVSRYLPFKNEYGRKVMFDKYTPPCQMMTVLANTNKDPYYEDDILKIKFRIRYLYTLSPRSKEA